MDHKTIFSSAAAVVASLAMVMSTGALGACKTTLRGELVQAPGPRPAFPRLPAGLRRPSGMIIQDYAVRARTNASVADAKASSVKRTSSAVWASET